MKKNRILYISSTYSRDERDNQNPWMIDTIRHLREAGYEVEVLAPSYKGLKSHVVGGVTVHRFRYFFAARETLTHDQGAPNKIRGSLLFKLLFFPYLACGSLAAMRLVRRRDYDFIHCHWPFPHGLIGWAACRAARNRPAYVLHFHGACLLLAAKFKPIAPLLRFCIRRADGVVSNSRFTAGLVDKLLPPPVPQRIIAFGSPLQGEPLPPPRRPEKLILTVGRLVERKGIVYLLRALPEIAAACDARLAIVGAGDPQVEAGLREVTAELHLEGRVIFAGKVPEAELVRWYRDCDVFCLPAIVDSQGETEGLGVVLLEALTYARPVVASDVGGIPDIVRPGETGLLCPQKDPAALARALLDLLQNPERAERLGRQGREMVQREYSWEHVIAEWDAFYREAGKRSWG